MIDSARSLTAYRTPVVIIQPTRGWAALQLRQIWQYHELLYFLVWRDVKIRYKQTALGVMWIVLQPIISMIVFSGLFGALLNVPTGTTPYPLFVYAGLVPWNYFAGSLSRSSTGLVDNANLITKVYFPRVIVPLSGVLAGLIDFGVSISVLALLMLVYHVQLTFAILLLPAFLLLAMATALGFGLWLSALNVRYRDIKQLMPFVVQIWMYVTPVVYGATLIPEKYRWLLALNPMTIVVEGFRWTLLGTSSSFEQVSWGIVVISLIVVGATLISGIVYFRNTERTFADIV